MQKSAFGLGCDMDKLAIDVTAALKKAMEQMADIMDERGYNTRHGCGQFRWNPIIKYLSSMCNHVGWIEFGKIRRRAWEVPVLFYPSGRVILTFMSETTFEDLQRRKNKDKHYLYSCASFNTDVEGDQTCLDLPGAPIESKPWVVQTRSQLANAIRADVGDISGHILVLFDSLDNELISVRAVCLTPELEISSKQENWSVYIKNSCDTDQQVEPQQNDDDDEMLVTL